MLFLAVLEITKFKVLILRNDNKMAYLQNVKSLRNTSKFKHLRKNACLFLWIADIPLFGTTSPFLSILLKILTLKFPKGVNYNLCTRIWFQFRNSILGNCLAYLRATGHTTRFWKGNFISIGFTRAPAGKLREPLRVIYLKSLTYPPPRGDQGNPEILCGTTA